MPHPWCCYGPKTSFGSGALLHVRRLCCLGLLVLCNGLLSQPASAAFTERASIDSSGTQATGGESNYPGLSANGRFVAFCSAATNLVTGDTNGLSDVFVRDRMTGGTERVSVDSAGAQATGGGSCYLAINAGGRFVAFSSDATNLVVNDTNAAADIFVHDRQTGITERVSVDSAGGQGNSASGFPAISADGRFVTFHSDATNLVANDTNGDTDVFVHDRKTGATTRVSVDSVGAQGNNDSSYPDISASSRFVAFHSSATNLVVNDTNATNDVFVHDRLTGTTKRVSVGGAGTQANSDSQYPSISLDGRFVAFHSSATNLVTGDTNAEDDIFVRDRLAGVTERISVDSAGNQANSVSYFPRISANGRIVIFESFATNLVAGDTNGAYDMFTHDRQTGTTERVSVDSAGGQANSDSLGAYSRSISANGRFVTYHSEASNLVAGDTNGVPDIFVRDRGLSSDGNDLLVDFGGSGLWEYLNNATWQKIHNASPTMIGAGDLDGRLQNEVLASFSGLGLWARYNDATWVRLHNGAPTRFIAGDFDGDGEDDLTVDFGGSGIWVRYNNATWMKLHNGTSQGLAAGDLDGNGKDELIADFGGAGLWVRYNDTAWAKRHNASPVHIATGDLDGNGQDELIADFGAGGIWSRYNDATWLKLNNVGAQGLATGDLDGNDQEELIADFGGAGLWVRYNNSTWIKRNKASPEEVLATDLDDNGKSELVADFGPFGLWARYNNAIWMKIHNADPQDIAAGGFD